MHSKIFVVTEKDAKCPCDPDWLDSDSAYEYLSGTIGCDYVDELDDCTVTECIDDFVSVISAERMDADGWCKVNRFDFLDKAAEDFKNTLVALNTMANNPDFLPRFKGIDNWSQDAPSIAATLSSCKEAYDDEYGWYVLLDDYMMTFHSFLRHCYLRAQKNNLIEIKVLTVWDYHF